MGINFSFHYHQTIYINKDTNEVRIELCRCNKKGFTRKIILSDINYKNKLEKYQPIFREDYDKFFD